MATDRAELARAGTMEVTSKEGKAYLDKNLTEWKKPQLMDHMADDDKSTSSAGSSTRVKKKQAAKQGAAKSPAKGGSPAKKARFSKATTMAATAKEGRALLGEESLGDTRLMTHVVKNVPLGALKKSTTMQKTVDEGNALLGRAVNPSEGRILRKRASVPVKSPMKKSGTMKRTAKEGKEFLKRGKKKQTTNSDGV